MKSLEDFRIESLLEEETSDYSKFDMLVRAGLANKAQLQRIHKILDKMQEDRPQFNNADRQILQNLFNKMVDLISNNKQIFQKTRQAVREEVELDESVLDTTDFKLGPSGKKVKAHRVKVGDIGFIKDKDDEELKENISRGEPPFVLVLKRKAFRLYPNNLRVALYYNDKLDKYFSVPYIEDGNTKSVIQAESIEKTILQSLYEIVESSEPEIVKFENNETVNVGYDTAKIIVDLYSSLNEENRDKLVDILGKSLNEFNKVYSFAISKLK